MKDFIDQHAITAIAVIDPDKLHALQHLLKMIGDDVENNPILPLKQLAGVHFCRFLILPKSGMIPDQLAYATNFDESEEAHFAAIQHPSVLPGFHQLFSCCQNYRNDVPAFIKAHQHKVHTFYRGHRGFSLVQIQQEYKLYRSIQEFLNKENLRDLTEKQIKQKIENDIPLGVNSKVIRLGHLSLPAMAALYLLLPLLILLAAAYALGILIPFGIALVTVLAIVIAYLRYLESNADELSDKGSIILGSQDQAKVLTRFEDFQVQNQLSHLVELRPGFFRRGLQRFALAALNKLAILTYNRSRLGDISTIHFARWSLIDGGKRLLFFSNFDGSWENYLGDFVDRAAIGLTLAWSNTQEFPKTRFLFLDGATNEELFKTWTRKYQIVTDVWYTAYKDLTVKNIVRNHQIAVGIGKDLSGKELKEWLKLL